MIHGQAFGSRRGGWRWLVAAAVLGGCAAGSQQHKEGMQLLDQGRYEEGLALLEEAVRLGPERLNYRTALIAQRERLVNRLLAEADGERRGGRTEAARTAYERVLRLEAGNGAARTGLAALAADRRHAQAIEEATALLARHDGEGARAALRPVLLEDPGSEEAQALLRRIDEQAARESLSPSGLRAMFRKPVNLQFRDANLKVVFEALSRTSGINVLMDKDVKADIKTSIFVKGVSVEDAIDLILLQNQLEKKVVSDNTVFVYPNSPAKLKDYQDLKIRSFHLANADAKQMLTMVKTLLKTKDIFVHEKTNSLVIRDTPDAIRLAEKLIADQDSAEPEVMLEVEVLEVARSRLSEIGIKYPDQLTLTAQGSATGTGQGAASALTVEDLRHLNGSRILASPALSVGFNLHSDHGDVNVLASPRIRAKNREKAKIMIGDRVPIITNAITPVATGAPVVTGSVQYLDVGLKLEVEPDINPDNLVSIKVSMEVSSIAKEVPNAQSGTLAYQVGTRNASTVLRLRDGETQVLAGLLSDQDRKTSVEVPFLGMIPVLGRLLSSHRNDVSKSEIVLSITPRVVRTARLRDARELEYWSGTESALRQAPLLLKPMGSVTVSSAAGQAPARNRAAAGARAPAAPEPAAAADAVEVPVPAAGEAPAPMGLAWQGPAEARVGEQVRLFINSSSGLGLKSLGLLVAFDPAVLKVVDVAAGDLLRQAEPPPSFTRAIDQSSGQIVVDLASSTGVAARGGPVVVLTFEVTGAAQESRIAISRIVSAGLAGEAVALAAPAAHRLVLAQ